MYEDPMGMSSGYQFEAPDLTVTAGGGLSGAAGDWLSAIPFVGDAVGAARAREQQQYDRWLTQEMWSREDNAVQRRAADLKAAGMSPLLAAGASAQTGAMARSSAPESSTGGLGQIVGMLAQSAGIAQSKAQTRLLEANARKAEVEADYLQREKDLALRSGEANASYLEQSLQSRVDQQLAAARSAKSKAAVNELDATLREMEQAGLATAAQLQYMEASIRKYWLAGYDRWPLKMEDGSMVYIDLHSMKNASEAEFLAKTLAYELMQKEKKWFVAGKLIGAGTSLVGTAINAFTGYQSGMLNYAKRLTPSEF